MLTMSKRSLRSVNLAAVTEATNRTRMWADVQLEGRPAEYIGGANEERKFRNSLPCPKQQSLAGAHCSSAMQ